MAERAEAEAALEGLDFGDFGEQEFDQIAEECVEMEKARAAEAAATATSTATNMDTTMSTDLPAEPATFAAPMISFGSPVTFLAGATTPTSLTSVFAAGRRPLPPPFLLERRPRARSSSLVGHLVVFQA